MKLSQLLAGLECRLSGGDPEITGVACDSRRAAPGCVFVALPGARADGHRFIPAAVAAGAAAVVAERPVEGLSVPTVVTPNTRRALALISAAFYGHPAQRLTLVGVTGTKGKTTTTHILKAILEAAGHKTAMVGTVGCFIGAERVAETLNTTPESLELHRFFAQAVEAGCTHAVMEVSSQALKLDRTYGLRFDLALFLNLSPDHIGGAEHKDFAEYLSCKAMLFRQCAAAAGNRDDPRFGEIFSGCTAPVTTFGFAPGADVRGGAVRPVRRGGALGSEFSVSGYAAPLEFSMPGEFNAADALAAVAAARVLDLPEEAVRRGLRAAAVRGRTETYPHGGDFTVLIDYAHNDVSFASLLSTLRKYTEIAAPPREGAEARDPADKPSSTGRIIAVFGAGGDRPKMRRADMAREAAKYADFAVVTADNPRSERVEDICADITAALAGKIPSVEIYDRTQAIRYALDMAGPGDIVALLGKGHEEYIEVNGVRSHFSEREVLDAWFAGR